VHAAVRVALFRAGYITIETLMLNGPAIAVIGMYASAFMIGFQTLSKPDTQRNM
jgi:hypothetical protein